MQVISSRRDRRRQPASAAQILFGGFIGATLLVAGAALGWLAFATPLLHAFDMPVRPSGTQMAVGATAWALALTAPAGCVIIGLARLLGTTEKIADRRPRPSVVSSLAGELGDEYTVAVGVILPDGRGVPEVVVGPHGVAIVESAPPSSLARHVDRRWEAKVRDGSWLPIESPLDRAVRDAERVRRWFAAEDRDFVVKVYAALVSSDPTLPRTPGCVVLTRDQIPGWLASLPPQRTLTPSRRERVLALIQKSV